MQCILVVLCSLYVASGLSSLAAASTPRPALRAVSQRAQQRFAAQIRLAVDEEEEVEEMTEEEFAEAESADPSSPAFNPGKLKSESGVELAPWLKIDAKAIAEAKAKNEARKAKAAASNAALDQMALDPQAAELGAKGGLKSKVLADDEVELRWETGDETDNKGFIIQRRPGGTDKFEEIASWEKFPQLRTKGVQGGTYLFIDDDGVCPGTWVYRILDDDEYGKRSAICQKLVEVEAQSEQTFTLVLGGFFAAVALAFVALGVLSDPIQTTDISRL